RRPQVVPSGGPPFCRGPRPGFLFPLPGGLLEEKGESWVVKAAWNRYLGWTLLLAGFWGAVWLDPWSLSQRDAGSLAGSLRLAARQAQAGVVQMAFLQLVLARVLAGEGLAVRSRRLTVGLSG